jgi:hypothetical protein
MYLTIFGELRFFSQEGQNCLFGYALRELTKEEGIFSKLLGTEVPSFLWADLSV